MNSQENGALEMVQLNILVVTAKIRTYGRICCSAVDYVS